MEASESESSADADADASVFFPSVGRFPSRARLGIVKVQLQDVEVPALLRELLVGVREKLVQVAERLDAPEHVEILRHVPVSAGADGELRVEPPRGDEMVQRALVRDDVPVPTVHAPVRPDPTMQLIIGKTHLRRRVVPVCRRGARRFAAEGRQARRAGQSGREAGSR